MTTSSSAPGPLARFHVLDLTTAAGQPGGRVLADLGADVIKIEPPGGDQARSWAPFAGGKPHPEKSIYFLHFNTNKRGIVLDIASAQGKETFLQLVQTADVVLESFTPGYLASLGLGYETLEKQRPGLVLTSITPFGQTGPYHDFLGNDLIANAMGGHLFMEGEREGRPAAAPRYQAYQMAGLHAAYGTLLALWHSRRTGQGQQVDVSLQEVIAHEYFNLVNYASYQEIVQRVGTLSQGRPTGFFPCKDGWVAISLIMPNQWKAFAEWTQDPLLMDPMFDNHAVRAEAVEFIDERITEFMQTLTVEEFMQGSIPRRIPAAPMNDVPGFVEHPHTKARQFLVEVEHSVAGRYRAPGASAIYSASPWRIRRPAPALGQHTEEVLRELKNPHLNPPPQSPVGAHGRAPSSGIPSPSAPRLPATAPRGAAANKPRMPLEGLRVLDLTKSWAGPFGARYLADFGAEVIKVESIKFPEGRQLTVQPDPANWRRSNTMYAEINRNKLSITLDLHMEEGRDLLKKLAASSDVLVENFHYATLPRWGLSYTELRKVNPRLIMLSAPGFGSTGPARDYFAYGTCVSGFNGIAQLWGHPGATNSEKAKQAYTDFVTAANLALAVVAALHHRDATGEGQYIELAQSEAGANMIGTAIMEYTINRTTPQPWGNRDPNIAPQGVYPSRGDDRWVAISCLTQGQWEALRQVMGDPQWARDSRFSTLEGRLQHHDELHRGVAEWTKTLTPHQAMLKLQGAGVPAGVVATGEDLYRDPHLREREYVVEIEHSAPGRLEHPGMTVKLTRTPGGVQLPAPLTGQDTHQVLERVLGLGEREREALEAKGVLS